MNTATHDLLGEMVGLLSEEFQPEQVWLFGSRVSAEPSESSDFDLLVIVTQSDEPPVRRAQRAHRCLRAVPAAVDVVVKTRAEVEKFRNVSSSLESLILRNGRLIYGSSQT